MILTIFSQAVLDWIGYIASFIVLVSLLMTSLKKLRWINLIGSVMFGTYGFLILSIPTGLMNVGIAIINIYYLYKMYSSSEYFKILEIKPTSDYLSSFLKFYKKDITSFTSTDISELNKSDLTFFILRDMTPASILAGKYSKDGVLNITLDYAIPQYRDFKLGKFLFSSNKAFFISKGISKLVTKTTVLEHQKYLKKMGFVQGEVDSSTYELVIK
jgi:hypothetical protein